MFSLVFSFLIKSHVICSFRSTREQSGRTMRGTGFGRNISRLSVHAEVDPRELRYDCAYLIFPVSSANSFYTVLALLLLTSIFLCRR